MAISFLCLVRSTDTMRKCYNPLVSASYMVDNYYVIRMKFQWGFSYVTHYMKHSLLGTRRVISSIITRNFFVTRNKQPMTIGTNRMCISRDDNCVNTMCFPRQLPTTAWKYDDLLSLLSSRCVIRVVLSVSYLLVSCFVMNFLRRIFLVCHSFRSMCQSGCLNERFPKVLQSHLQMVCGILLHLPYLHFDNCLICSIFSREEVHPGCVKYSHHCDVSVSPTLQWTVPVAQQAWCCASYKFMLDCKLQLKHC